HVVLMSFLNHVARIDPRSNRYSYSGESHCRSCSAFALLPEVRSILLTAGAQVHRVLDELHKFSQSSSKAFREISWHATSALVSSTRNSNKNVAHATMPKINAASAGQKPTAAHAQKKTISGAELRAPTINKYISSDFRICPPQANAG